MNKLGLIKFCNLSLELHFVDFGIFEASQTPSLVSAPKIPKNHESQTENPSVVDSLHESKSKIICHCEVNYRFAEAIQKIAQPNLARFVVQKIGIKDAVVPSADFLLESGKRGSPPKSEKAAAFWRVGGAGRGVQPFLRKEKGEIDDKRFAESNLDFANYAKVAGYTL